MNLKSRRWNWCGLIKHWHDTHRQILYWVLDSHLGRFCTHSGTLVNGSHLPLSVPAIPWPCLALPTSDLCLGCSLNRDPLLQIPTWLIPHLLQRSAQIPYSHWDNHDLPFVHTTDLPTFLFFNRLIIFEQPLKLTYPFFIIVFIKSLPNRM